MINREFSDEAHEAHLAAMPRRLRKIVERHGIAYDDGAGTRWHPPGALRGSVTLVEKSTTTRPTASSAPQQTAPAPGDTADLLAEIRAVDHDGAFDDFSSKYLDGLPPPRAERSAPPPAKTLDTSDLLVELLDSIGGAR